MLLRADDGCLHGRRLTLPGALLRRAVRKRRWRLTNQSRRLCVLCQAHRIQRADHVGRRLLRDSLGSLLSQLVRSASLSRVINRAHPILHVAGSGLLSGGLFESSVDLLARRRTLIDHRLEVLRRLRQRCLQRCPALSVRPLAVTLSTKHRDVLVGQLV